MFVSLQRIVASSIRLPGLASDRSSGLAEVWDDKGNLVALDGLLGPPKAETIIHMRRLVEMYLEEVVKLRDADVDVSPASADHKLTCRMRQKSSTSPSITS